MIAALMFVAGVAVAIAVAIAVVADRTARASAWRRIARERRWNHEHHRPRR